MNCGWLLYRQPYGKTFRFLCGRYQQSHGARCSHNHVDGQTTTRFIPSCIRRRALSPQYLQKLEKRIRQLAAADRDDNRVEEEVARKQAILREVEAERDQAKQNLARAKTDEQNQAVACVFDQLYEKAKSIEAEIAAAQGHPTITTDANSAVDMAMETISRLTELSRDGEDLGAARQIFDLLNARLFLGFQPAKEKKRNLNKINRGVVTFGAAPPPIDIYEGPTARKRIKGPVAFDAAGPGDRHLPSPPRKL